MNWPGLTSTLVSQHLETPIATIRGHMKQERNFLQSTKTTDTEFFPVHDTPNNTKTNEVVCTIIDFKDTKKAYGDLTGRFPFTSSREISICFVSAFELYNSAYDFIRFCVIRCIMNWEKISICSFCGL